MPGTVVATTLNDGTRSASATDAIRGSAKAWINFNGSSTGVTRASYNVQSLTFLATGQFRITFTAPMANENYAVLFGAGGADSGRAQLYLLPSVSGVAIPAPEGTNKTFQFVEVGGNVSTNPNSPLPSFNVAVIS